MRALVYPHPYKHMAVTVAFATEAAHEKPAPLLAYDAPPATSAAIFRRGVKATLRQLGFRVYTE